MVVMSILSMVGAKLFGDFEYTRKFCSIMCHEVTPKGKALT